MLRNGLPSDAEAIENIRIAAWRSAYRDFMPASYLAKLEIQKNIDGLQQRLATQSVDFSVIVAEINSSVVGFMILGKPRYHTSNHSIELWALNVHPKYWRNGIGGQLIQKAIDSAKGLNVKSIELWCINGNLIAENAYKRAGFIAVGKQRTSSDLTGHPIHERLYVKKL